MFVLLYLRLYFVRHSKNKIYINYNLNLYLISCYRVSFTPKVVFACHSGPFHHLLAYLLYIYVVVKICALSWAAFIWWFSQNASEELHVREFVSMLNHGLYKLLEDSIHVGGLPWPDSLQKTNMASIRSKNQSNIRVLLSSFYWNSLREKKRVGSKRGKERGKIQLLPIFG